MRKGLIQMHLWLGLVLGLLWSIQGITGAALVFHREIDRAAHPEWSGGMAALPLSALIAKAGAAAEKPIDSIGAMDGKPDLYSAFYKDRGERRAVLIDPASGRILGDRAMEPTVPEEGSTSRFLYNLHQHLLSGDTGEWFIGLSGMFLLTTVVIGLAIAWPRRGNWRKLVAAGRWRTMVQQLFGWHRLGGMLLMLVLATIAIGGIYMSFAEGSRRLLGALVPLEMPYRAKPLDGLQPDSWSGADEALSTARARWPEAGFVRLSLPTAKLPAYVVRLRQDGEVRAWAGTSAITVDATSGKIANVYDALEAPLANRVLDSLFSLHNGEAGGLFGRLLVALAGLSLPAFYVSGILLWWRRRARPGKAAGPTSLANARQAA